MLLSLKSVFNKDKVAVIQMALKKQKNEGSIFSA